MESMRSLTRTARHTSAVLYCCIFGECDENFVDSDSDPEHSLFVQTKFSCPGWLRKRSKLSKCGSSAKSLGFTRSGFCVFVKFQNIFEDRCLQCAEAKSSFLSNAQAMPIEHHSFCLYCFSTFDPSSRLYISDMLFCMGYI
jgi:hypothetical protein